MWRDGHRARANGEAKHGDHPQAHLDIEGRALDGLDRRLQRSGKRPAYQTFATKKAADGFMVMARHEVRQGTHTADSASITVAQAADLWIEHAEALGRERSTTKQYEAHARLHIKPLIGATKLSRLTAPSVEAFKDQLFETRSETVTRKVLTSLKSIVGEAQRRGLVAFNAARDVKMARKTRGADKPGWKGRAAKIPTKDEVKTLLGAVGDRWRPLLVTAVFTGLRCSELRGLTWGDMDLEGKTLTVRQRADQWGVMGPPKSEAGERTIPLTPIVVNTLKSWRENCPKGDLGLAFPNHKGAVVSHATIVDRMLAPLQVECGILKPEKVGADGKALPPKARCGLHALRHFFASWIIEQNFTPKKVQTLMGHASITMTFDTYGHLFPSAEDDLARMTAAEGFMSQSCRAG